MATVHFAFTTAMQGNTPTFGGSPRGETETGGGTTTLTLGNNEICRAVAVTGASYVALGSVASETVGYYLAEGTSIEMHGAPGDTATQADV